MTEHGMFEVMLDRNGMKKPAKRWDYIAVDFDGTLVEHKFPEIGAPVQPVIDFIRYHHALGSKIILWTCRDDEQDDTYTGYLTAAVRWCAEHGVPIDAVNENPWVSFGKGKMYADIYIDDRAIPAQWFDDKKPRLRRRRWLMKQAI